MQETMPLHALFLANAICVFLPVARIPSVTSFANCLFNCQKMKLGYIDAGYLLPLNDPFHHQLQPAQEQLQFWQHDDTGKCYTYKSTAFVALAHD